MIFCNPTNPTFSVSADYALDTGKSVRSLLPCVIYDGGFDPVSLHSRSKMAMEPYDPGSAVYAHLEAEGITVTGQVLAIPTRSKPCQDCNFPMISASTYLPNLFGTNKTTYAWRQSAILIASTKIRFRLCDVCGITVRTLNSCKRGTPECGAVDDEPTWTLRVAPSDVVEDDDRETHELENLNRIWQRCMMDWDLMAGWPADPKTAEMGLWLKLSAATPGEITDATPT